MSQRRIKRRRMVKLPPGTLHAMEMQRNEFRMKFGRDPGPDDPVFFDPDSDTPTPIDPQRVTIEIIAAMEKAGIPPDKIYAFRKTGMLPTEENIHLWSAADLREWQGAIEEFERIQSKGKQ